MSKRRARPAKRGFIGSMQIHRMADHRGSFKSRMRDVPAGRSSAWLDFPPDWEDVTPEEAEMTAIIGHPQRPK